MKPRFSIIIVTWNALDHLRHFLPSVAATSYPDFEIVIADNASTDESSEWIRENIPGIKIATLDQNYGYCGGNNRAVKYADGDILIFLNNDVRVEPDWLHPLARTFNDKSIGVAQPKMLSATEPDKFEYAGAAGGMIDKLGYPFCKGRIFDVVEKDTGQYDEPDEIFWASGAAFAVRKDLFLELGGFDEDFEFHMEEIDFCWRAHKMGNRVMSQPESVVYHLGGGSLPMGSPRKVYYNYRNSLIMLTKNLDSFMVPKILFRLILDGLAGIRSLFLGRPAETWAIIRAHFAYYARLGKTLKKRKHQLYSEYHPTPQHLVYQKLIVVQALLFGKKTYPELDK
ncbi:glycosyltransferase family 2 protein [Rhodohalobacter mucosus]|uniref:Glycosyltransferase family 2 protein n=1 Tax=Rhodohalobacter mucosus TaxID=2079485 RepID=A0A316TQW7_9BACT|nr:glycosyltransferase family 2 protein [Rhodohalobacter mucosus]PWN07013.1 glycosyltransferase family 2 protein [Rhodohalobacter mucosus]